MPRPPSPAPVAVEGGGSSGATPDAAFEKVLGCVHALSACAHEFWPEHPYALTEHTEALCDALDAWGAAVDESAGAEPSALAVTPDPIFKTSDAPSPICAKCGGKKLGQFPVCPRCDGKQHFA